VADLRKQCPAMYDVVKRHNGYFWPALLSPERHATASPSIYTLGSEAANVLAFQNPGIQLLR
jgi:hypothetical protein